MPATTRRFPLLRGERLLLVLLVLYVGLLSALPLLRLVVEALAPGGDGAFLGVLRESWSSRAVRRAFSNTVTASVGSVAISAALGTALALCLTLARVRWRVAATFLVLSPLLIPSQIMALAWIELIGAVTPLLSSLGLAPARGPNPLYSGWGIALLMGIEHMPFVFLAVRASLAFLPQDLVEAARVAGARRGRILARIVLPLAAPAILAGSILAFAAAVGNFGVPALLGIPGRFPMLTTLIYQRLNGFGVSMMGQVAALALILMALAGAALLVRALLLRRLSVPVAAGARLNPMAEAGWANAGASALVWICVVLIAIAPMAALVTASLTPAVGVRLSAETATLVNYASAVFGSATVRRAFGNSFWLSLAAAGIATLVAVPFAYLSAMRKSTPARVLSGIADMPFVMPGTVFALAMILVFLRPLPLVGVSIYGTATILLIAYAARFLPIVLRPTGAALEAVEPALDEAGRMLGAGLWRRLTLIVAPAAAPAAVAGGLLVFMTAFNELTVSALLWSSGVETVGVMIFSLQYEGNSTGAAALSVLSILFVLVLALFVDALRPRLPAGTLPWRD